MGDHVKLLRGSAAAVSDLAVLIASVRDDVNPGAERVRSVLVMCEEDLLSAADAIGKALDRVEDCESPFRSDGRLSAPGRVAVRTGRVRRRNDVSPDQSALFALPALAV